MRRRSVAFRFGAIPQHSAVTATNPAFGLSGYLEEARGGSGCICAAFLMPAEGCRCGMPTCTLQGTRPQSNNRQNKKLFSDIAIGAFREKKIDAQKA